jgi:hypothetical protein
MYIAPVCSVAARVSVLSCPGNISRAQYSCSTPTDQGRPQTRSSTTVPARRKDQAPYPVSGGWRGAAAASPPSVVARSKVGEVRPEEGGEPASASSSNTAVRSVIEPQREGAAEGAADVVADAGREGRGATSFEGGK